MPKYRLVSFKTCPFVQRAAIMLRAKNVDYDIESIDLRNKPDWLLELSPLGKVPILEVDGTVLFESQVIAEYLDEVEAPSMHPTRLTPGPRRRAGWYPAPVDGQFDAPVDGPLARARAPALRARGMSRGRVGRG